jgi:hypothetical protein
MTGSTSSTSSTTGQLVVTGGVGISQNLNVGGAVVITGNLTVNGTTTTINSTTMTVDNILIELGDIATPTNITANGGGMLLKAQTNKTITWASSSNRWTSNVGFEAPQIIDTIGNVRNIPQTVATSAYVLVATDAGKHISITTGGVTVPASIFSIGDTVIVYNNSSSNQTVTQGTSVTMYLAGTATTGDRTLAQRGYARLLCVASNQFVITGEGLT